MPYLPKDLKNQVLETLKITDNDNIKTRLINNNLKINLLII